MNKRILFLCLLIVLLSAAIPVLADEELLWSNFNTDPVKNTPEHYSVFKRDEKDNRVLITRIRTFHWNNGNGAEPGQICVREGITKKDIQCWQAVGRSAYGVPNVYWEVLTDFVMEPGHSYGFRASDFDSWSHNEASSGFGMLELYGENPAPVSYAAAASSNSGGSVPSVLRVGQTFKMGRYEQDNNLNNGPEPIEWQVLTVYSGRALVISKYVLEVRAYYNAGSTWEVHKDRKWLNEDFYNTAFTDAEKNNILLAVNENPDNTAYGTRGGNQTQDKIFYLSIDETNYFSSDDNRKAKPTAYTAAQGIMVLEPYGGATYWSLRSPGYMESIRAYIDADGITYPGLILPDGFQDPVIGARPAFWMKTSSAASPASTPKTRTCFKVTYTGNNCLAKVPADSKCYHLGDLVTVLFEPVEYMQSLIFNGWDMDGDNAADFGYNYPTFAMPNHDVELKAVCYQQYQDYNYSQYGVTTGEVDPNYYDPHQYYNPNNDPTLNNDIYDPNTGWWFSPEDYNDYYGIG